MVRRHTVSHCRPQLISHRIQLIEYQGGLVALDYDAELLLKRSLAIREKALDPDDLNVAKSFISRHAVN
jgi:hypothetical protein